MERLVHEDLIIRKDLATTAAGVSVVEVINFTFDEFRDYLIADYLVKNIWPSDKDRFEQLTDSLIKIEHQFSGNQCHPMIVPLPIAEGVSRFLFQIIRHRNLTELEQLTKTKRWYQNTFFDSVFEIEDHFVECDDVRQVKQFFLENIHNSSSVCWHLLHRYDLDQYKNLNINTLFEIFRSLDSARYSELVNPIFQTYAPRPSSKDFTWPVDAVVRKLQRLLSSQEHFLLFELLIFLFDVPSRNYYSPALDLYDEFVQLQPDLAMAQLLRNINANNIGIRTHVWEKLGHLYENGFRIPELKNLVRDVVAELKEKPQLDYKYDNRLLLVLSKISVEDSAVVSDNDLHFIKAKLEAERGNKHVNNVWGRILRNRPKKSDT